MVGLTTGTTSAFGITKHAITRLTEGLRYDLQAAESKLKAGTVSAWCNVHQMLYADRNRPERFTVPRDEQALAALAERRRSRHARKHQHLMVRRAYSDVIALRLFAAYVPLDLEHRRNRSFGVLLVRKPRISGLLLAAWPLIRYFAQSVFREDRIAVEAEQRAWAAQGGEWNCELSPVLLEFWRVLRECGRSQTKPP